MNIHMCLCGYVHICSMCVPVCVYLYRETRCQHWLSSFALRHIIVDRVSDYALSWSSQARLDWLASIPKESSCLCLTNAGISDVFYHT